MSVYPRITIKGVLTTRSNLHLGTGQEEIGADQTLFNQHCLDFNGNPYIPASSLRGYLRQIISEQLDENTVNELFGLARQHTDAEEMGNSGLIRIQDCRWDSGVYDEMLISQTSIDPVTATAKHHHLSTHAIVPSNSRFLVHIELDKANEQQLTYILQALQTFGEQNKGKLGKGKSTGQGACDWLLNEKGVKVLSKEVLKEWLVSENYANARNKRNRKKLETYFIEPKELNIFSIVPFNTSYKKITLLLKANSPILINDPHAVEKRKKDNQDSDKQQPKLIFKQQSKQAIIPGSTLKGWTRARGRRIVLTLLNNQQDKQNIEIIADNLLDEIFGSTQQQSHIYFEDAKVAIDESNIHLQTFTAIDRFTGGVKEGALYNVEAIWPDKPFLAQIQQTTELKDWMKLLMLYILRDSMEGDLVLGWGKSKGYGRVQLSLAEHQDWSSLYNSIKPTDLEQWDNDLQQKLKGGNI